MSAEGWILTSAEVYRLLEKLKNIGTPLEKHVDSGFYRGVTTGCNDAFIIDESVRQHLITEDARNSELIKPVLRGRDLKKWKTGSTGNYLIFTRQGIDIDQYPAIKQYLNQYRLELEPKRNRSKKRGRKIGNYKWYEIQDITAYYTEFEKLKIIYPQTAKSLYACYDTVQTFGLNSTYFISTNDLSLLAILNSRFFDWYARYNFQSLNDPWAGGRLQFLAQYMKHVPIADRTPVQKSRIDFMVVVKLTTNDSVTDPHKAITTCVTSTERLDATNRLAIGVSVQYGLTDAEVEFD